MAIFIAPMRKGGIMKRIKKEDYPNHLFGMVILDHLAEPGKKGATIYATEYGALKREPVVSYKDENRARQLLERLNRGRE